MLGSIRLGYQARQTSHKPSDNVGFDPEMLRRFARSFISDQCVAMASLRNRTIRNGRPASAVPQRKITRSTTTATAREPRLAGRGARPCSISADSAAASAQTRIRRGEAAMAERASMRSGRIRRTALRVRYLIRILQCERGRSDCQMPRKRAKVAPISRTRLVVRYALLALLVMLVGGLLVLPLIEPSWR